MNTVLFKNDQKYTEKICKRESEIEDLIVTHSKKLFGNNAIYIDAKKKIDNSALGGVIPDGFLFDLSDINNPEFHIVEAELAKHSFFNHIFPQITKFFAFFKNSESQGKLIEKLYSILIDDSEIHRAFKSKIGNREIFKFLKDTVENSQSILIIIDHEKSEFPEIIQTYGDTWGKMVKIAILKEYVSLSGENIISMSPEFENIGNVDIISNEQDLSKIGIAYLESFHLDNVTEEIKNLYQELRHKLSDKIPSLHFNSQRYYISLRKKRNFAYIKIRRKKIIIIALMSETNIRKRLINHNITPLSQNVQNYYNGACASIEVTNKNHLDDVIELLCDIQK